MVVAWRYVDNSSRLVDLRRTVPPFTDDTRTTITPYALATEEISKLQQSALAGDCAAAFRLGKHHSFFSLNHAAAVGWLRLAARCPNANAKGNLVALLRELPEHSMEVDQLVREITESDPAMGKREVEAVRISREGQQK